MTDYDKTKEAASKVTEDFKEMLICLGEEQEELESQARIEMLEAENEKLRKALDFYQRERDRFKHNNPEMTGAFFLAGGHGPLDDNQMPQFVEICPAYGVGWTMVYEDTGRKISYEGS